MSKKSLLKILILIMTAALLGTLLLSCTPREDSEWDDIKSVPPDDPGIIIDFERPLAGGQVEAAQLVQEAWENRKKQTHVSDDPEWYVINMELDFRYLYDSVNPEEVTDVNIGAFIKFNMNLKDNSKSEVLLELSDLLYGRQLAGFYYADKTLYVDVGGNKYYTEALNFTQIGQLLGGALDGIGIDVPMILAGILSGDAGLQTINDILNMVRSLLINKYKAYETVYENGDRRDIGMVLDVDSILRILKTGIPMVLDEISWKGFGLPDFDPLMKQLIGFNLYDITHKDWPTMNTRLKAMTQREEFPDTDENGQEVTATGYVYKGFGLYVETAETDPAKGEHFMVDLKLTPVEMGYSDSKTFIDFSGYGLGSSGKGTTYQQAGLANLQIQGELFVENKRNGNISLGDILGTVIDLGDLADVPILFTDENAYVFGLDARIALDLFDYRNNRLEVSLNLQGQPFVRVYLDADVLYVDLSAIRDKTGQMLPNLKYSGLNINELLKGVLDSLKPFIDPDYVPEEGNVSDDGSGGGSGEITGGDEPGGEEGGEEGSSINVMSILDFILKNMNFNNADDNSYRIISVDLDASAINQLLGMFVNLPGELGLPGIHISVDQKDPLHTVQVNVQLSETVNAGLRITNLGYFAEPDFLNYDICDTAEKQATFADIMFTQHYNATLAGQASIGGNKTSGGVDLSGLIGLIADNILLNLGVSQTGGIDIKYELRANLDILNLERLEVSLVLYLPGENGAIDQDFLMVYYSGSDDTLYIDLQRVEVLKARLPALNVIGKLPALKIEDLGLAAILEGLNFDIGIQSPQNVFSTLLLGSPAYVMTDPYQFVADLYYNPLTLASVALAMAEGNGNAPEDTESGTDMSQIFDLIGGMLDKIEIDTRMNALQVVLNAQLLTVLMAFLNLDIAMPEVQGGLTVNLSGSKPDGDGYIKLEFSIQDSKVNDIKAIYLEWDVLNVIRVNVGKQNVIVGEFNLSDYTDLQTFIDDLVIGVKVAGNLELTSDEADYENDYLNGLIAGLIKGLGLKFRFGDAFGIRLSYEITGNIDINDILGSELSVVIRDKDAQKNVLGVYLIGRKLYLDLSYFGMPSIGLSDVSFIENLLKVGGSGTSAEQEVLENPSNAELSAWQAARASAYRELAHLDGPEKVTLQVWLGGDKVSINLAQDVIAALLGALLNGSELPVKFKDTSLELKLNDGIQLELQTGVEVLNLYLDLAEIRANVLKEELFDIGLPEDVTFLMADQLPDTSVYVKVGGSLYLKAEPEEGEDDITVDLAPALNKLLPSVPLNVFLQFLGVVDGQLTYEIEAAINFKDIIKSIAHISLTSHGDNVLAIYYDGGDMYIDSPIAKIGKVYIKDVASVIQDLINGSTETDSETEAMIKNLSEEQHEAYQYIDVMFQKGGIGLTITKIALLTVLSSLGIDLSEAFENIELQIDAGLYVHPVLGIELNVSFAGAKIGLSLGDVEFYVNKSIDMPSLDGYQTVEKLKTLEVFVGGALELGVYAQNGGQTDFSYIMDLIKGQIGEVSLPDGFDLESMLNFGLLLKVIGERFGGTVYLHVEASLNIENISDLQLGLYISSEEANQRYKESGNTNELGNVLAFYILGDANGALDAYLDGTGIGLEKIKLTDLSGFIGQFTNTTGTGLQTPVALPRNAAGQARDFDKFASGIILSIASDPAYQKEMNNAPVFLNVTAGAIFALLKSFNVDVEEYFGEFVPSASLSLFGENIFELRIGLKELLEVKAKLDMPVISVNANVDKFKNIAEDRSFYHINKEDKLNIKFAFNGVIDFQAKNTDEESEVNLTALLQHFLGETQFGVLLQNLGYAGKTITYEVQFASDLKALIAAATAEGEMNIEKILKAVNVLVTVRVDGNPLTVYLTNGSLYADLTLLNMGKIVIKDLANLKIGGSGEGESSVVNALSRPMNAAYNFGERTEMAYVSLVMGNDLGVYLSVAMDVIRIVLNGMGMPGDLIGDTVNDTLEIKLGVGYDDDLINLALKVANYSLKVSFNKVNVNFENTNVVLSGFDEQEYTEINENLSEVYVKLNLEFGLEMDADSHFNAREILDDLALISGLSIEPVISILQAISGNFLLEVEARLNIQSLFDSSLAVTLYAYDGITKTYVLSVVYLNRDLYLDAECFSIQKVRIVNAEEYFKTIIGIIKDLGKDEPSDPEALNAEDKLDPDVNPIAAYVNISLCPEGLVASVGSAALFAALQLAGLDIGKYVNPLGTIDIRAALLTPQEIISLNLKFLAHKTDVNNRPILDENGNYIPKGEGVELYFKINNDFVVELSTAKMPKISAPVGQYAEVSDSIPTLGIHTKIVLEFEAGEVSMDNLNKEPLASILGNVLSTVLMQIMLNVKGDQAARFELDILVNLNVLDIRAAEIQVVINKVDSDSVCRIAQANVYDGDMYVDLSPLGGPKFAIIEFMETILGQKDFDGESPDGEKPETELSLITIPELLAAGKLSNAAAESTKALTVNVQIQKAGLFVFVYKAAFNTLLSFLNLNDLEIFNDLSVNLFIKPTDNTIHLGLEADIQPTATSPKDGIRAYIALEGLGVNFQKYDNETLIIPQSSRYLQAHNIDVIDLNTTFEFGIETKEGRIALTDLFRKLLPDEDALSSTLPQNILLDTLGDTLVVDLAAKINISDLGKILDNLQIRGKIASKKAPDKFTLEITYYNNDIYIDGSGVGLSKIKIANISGLIEYFTKLIQGGGSGETPVSDATDAGQLLTRMSYLINNTDATDMAAQREMAEGTIKLSLDYENGLLVTVCSDMIRAVFLMLGFDINDFIEGVVAPEVSVGWTPQMTYEIKIDLNNDIRVEGENGGLHLRLALIGQNTSVDLEDEILVVTPSGMGTTIVPLISPEEQKEYTNYDKLTVYAETNISLTVDLKDGRLAADSALGMILNVLGLTVDQFMTDISFAGGNERLEVNLQGKAGVNFAKLLSRDWTQVREAISAYLQISYRIIDTNSNSVYHEQPLGTVYLTNDNIYLDIEIMSSHVKVKIPDAKLARMITGIFGMTPEGEDNAGNTSADDDSRYNRLLNMYSAFYSKDGTATVETLESVIRLNSSGLSLLITRALLANLGAFLIESFVPDDNSQLKDLTADKLDAVLRDIIDAAELKLNVEDGFSLDLRLYKDPEDKVTYTTAGYEIKLSLLNHTTIATDPETYGRFANYLSSDEALVKFYNECFDSRDLKWRVSAGLDFVLTADFMQYLLDWSGLFSNEGESAFGNSDTAFYIQVLDRLKGGAILGIRADIILKEIAELALDAIITVSDLDGNEVMGLYFMGNLTNKANYELAGPQLYLTVPGMGINGIQINAAVFEQFIGLNLLPLLQSIGQGGDKDPGEEDPEEGGDEDPDIGSIFDDPDNPYWFINVLDSIEFAKGKIAIVVAQTAIQTVMNALLGFPFDEVGKIRLVLDNVENSLSLEVALDYLPEFKLDAVRLGQIENYEDATTDSAEILASLFEIDEEFRTIFFAHNNQYRLFRRYDEEMSRYVYYFLYDNADQAMADAYVARFRKCGFISTKHFYPDNDSVDKKQYTMYAFNNTLSDLTANMTLIDDKLVLIVTDTMHKFNFGLAIKNIDVVLGQNNIFAAQLGENYVTYFEENFRPLNDYKWEFEINLEFTIDDTIGGLFDLSEPIEGIFGMLGDGTGILGALQQLKLALQPSEDIAITLSLSLRVFIDFSDLTPLRLQLALTYNGREIALVSYIGTLSNDYGEPDGTVYIDLSGLSLPSVKLNGINLGGIVGSLINNIDNASFRNAGFTDSDGVVPENAVMTAALATAMKAERGLDYVDLAGVGWDTAMLLLTASKTEFSIAITGALAYSLMHGLVGDKLNIPRFRNLQIGYSEKDNLAGIIIRLTDDEPYEQAFRIGLNFREGYSHFDSELKPAIDPKEKKGDNLTGEGIEYVDVGTLNELGLGLDMELRLRTKSADGGKTEQVEALEYLLERIIGMEEGSINLDLQSSMMVFGLSIKVYANLADLEQSTLYFGLSYAGEDFLSIYYFGRENAVYADLSGLGLFQAVVNGVDLMSIISVFLGGIITEGEGITVSEMISGLLSGLGAPNSSNAEDGAAVQSGLNNAENAGYDLHLSSNAPLIRILLGNETLTINPNASVLSLFLTGYDIPSFSDIRLSTNLAYGLNNLNFRLKLDPVGNNVTFNVAENMFGIKIGPRAKNEYQQQISQLGNKDDYGAVNGIVMNATEDSGINAGFNLAGMLTSLVDTINLDDLSIYLDKRNDYWYMRDLRYGMPIPAFLGGDGTGPYYFGYEDVGYGTKNGPLSFTIAGFEVSLIDTFKPVMMNNAYRRLRLMLDKTNNNMINVYLSQLTQVLGVTNNFHEADSWEPMQGRAFINDYLLRISLDSLLVFDVSDLAAKLIKLVLDQLINLIPIPGAGLVGGLITSLISPLLGDLVADLIGDLTGYGNPLKLGAIVDSVTGGGIAITNIFLPKLLASAPEAEYGSLYGRVTDENDRGIEGATLVLADGKYATQTDKDGRYAFINVPVNTYELTVTAPEGGQYQGLPEAGFDPMKVEILSYAEYPATEANWTLHDYTELHLDNVTVTGTVKDYAGKAQSGIVVTWDKDGDNSAIATTNADGVYTFRLNNVSGYVHMISAVVDSQQVEVPVSLGSMHEGRTVTVNVQAEESYQGQLVGYLRTLDDSALIEGHVLRDGGRNLKGIVADAEYRTELPAKYAVITSKYSNPIRVAYSPRHDAYYAVYAGGDLSNFNAQVMQLKQGGYTELENTDYLFRGIRDADADGGEQGKQVEIRRLSQAGYTVVAYRDRKLIPVTGDVELWLESAGGRTIRLSDAWDGSVNDSIEGASALDKQTPRNYLVVDQNGESKEMEATGRFQIKGLQYGKTYTVKIRSKVYNNFTVGDYVMQQSDNGGICNLNTILLTKREAHWSDAPSKAGSMLQGIRIRLGADVLDSNGVMDADYEQPNTDPGYTPDGLPNTAYKWLETLKDNLANTTINWLPGLAGSFISNSILKKIVESGLGAIVGNFTQDNNSEYKDEKGKPIFMPFTNYVSGFESGPADRSDNVTYIEAWLNSDFVANLLNMVNGLLQSMLGGMTAITKDQRYTMQDLAVAPEGTKTDYVKLNQFNGVFDESRDELIYERVYETEAEYRAALAGANAKLNAGAVSMLLNYVFTMLPDFAKNQYLRQAIQALATRFLDDVLDQITRMVSHILPLTSPYSMIEERDLNGSPLNTTAMSSTLNKAQTTDVKDLVEYEGALTRGKKVMDGNGTTATTPELGDDGSILSGYGREINFHDMSVYAKVVLNNHVDTMLDRIVLFLNGASYQNWDEPYKGLTSDYNFNSLIFAPEATVMRADTVYFDEDGNVKSESEKIHKILQRWIATNTVNSYIVVSDYRYEKDDNGVVSRKLLSETYVRDVYGHFDVEDWEYGIKVDGNPNSVDGEQVVKAVAELKDQYLKKISNSEADWVEKDTETGLSPKDEAEKTSRYTIQLMSAKDDHYLEIDINNTGIRLRVVRELAEGQFIYATLPDGSQNINAVPLLPPEKVVFHDPYNPLDFTAYGGTWAAEAGLSRHNVNPDGTYVVNSIEEILPNRNKATFRDGTSENSVGVQMVWDMSTVKFIPGQDTKGYIVGYCGNQVYGKNKNTNAIERIPVEVDGKLKVDPDSRLHIKEIANGLYEIDSENTSKVFDLDPIDPLNFDMEEYLSKLPDQFEYAVKMRYENDGMPEMFNIGGTQRDYVLKRYVFNDLEWSFDGTKLTTEGGDTSLQLTYGTRVAVDDEGKTYGKNSEKVTIRVPVKVKPRKAVSVFSVEEGIANGSYSEGIKDNKIIFNPLEDSDPKSTMESVTKLKVYSGEFDSGRILPNGEKEPIESMWEEEWQVLSVNASSLKKYDPKAITHPDYTVIYVLGDDFGLTQEVRVTVEILPRTIEWTNLNETFGSGDALIRMVSPFVDNATSTAERLGLLREIRVGYTGYIDENGDRDSSRMETLTEGKDYTWVVPEMEYTFTGKTKRFVGKVIIGTGDYVQTIDVTFEVEHLRPTGIGNILVYPYGDSRIRNTQSVVFHNGESYVTPAKKPNVYFRFAESVLDNFNYTPVEVDGVTYQTDVSLKNPSFAGNSYYADVLIPDEVFGNVLVENVNVVVLRSVISGLTFKLNGDEKLNQYFAEEEINALLSRAGHMLRIYQGDNGLVSDNYFDIVSWTFADEGGLSYKEENYLNIVVGNEGYVYHPVWSQEILVRLDDMSYLNENGAEAVDGNGKTLRKSLTEDLTIARILNRDNLTLSNDTYTLTIDDPYQTTLPKTLTVVYQDAAVSEATVRDLPVTWSLGEEMDDFYKKDLLMGTVTFGTGNNAQTFPVKYVNSRPRNQMDLKFFNDEDRTDLFNGTGNFNGYSVWAFDTWSLPQYATLTYQGETMLFPVYWASVESFTNTEDTDIEATAWVGDSVFGYVKETVTVHVKAERILSYRVPDMITLNAYGDIEVQIGNYVAKELAVTTTKGARTLSVVYPEIPLSYDSERQYELNFEVGIRTDFGKVGNVRTETWVENFGFEVRQAIPCTFIVEERYAIGIQNKLVGSIYDPVDFDALQQTTVLFRGGQSEVMEVSWNLDELTYTFLGGIFYVEATLGKGIDELEQTFTVRVDVRPSQLKSLSVPTGEALSEDSVVTADGTGAITELTVDPFVGFVGLPETITAHFIGVEETATVNVNWQFSKALKAMTLEGGRYDAENNMAAIATIYIPITDEAGKPVRTAIQSLEVPVTVLDRSIVGVKASRSEDGSNLQSINIVRNEMEFNPYAAQYSENFADENFSYYKYVTLEVRNGSGTKNIEFPLTAANWKICDAATQQATVMKDLYTGRNVKAELTFGPTNETAAKDATITINFNMKVKNMTYKSGLPVDLKVDPYGWKTNPGARGYDASYLNDLSEYEDGSMNKAYALTTEEGGEENYSVTFDLSKAYSVFDQYDRETGKITYKGGIGRIYAAFGNEYGGEQRVLIKVLYENREVTSLFDDKKVENYGEYGTQNGTQTGFILDPFERYDPLTSFVTTGEVTMQGETAAAWAEFTKMSVTWRDEKVKISYRGSTDGYVVAELSRMTDREFAEGEKDPLAGYRQYIRYHVKVMNKTVTGYTNVTKSQNPKVSPYRYLNSYDIANDVANDVFCPVGTKFQVKFAEGNYVIEFTLGGAASAHKRIIVHEDGSQEDGSKFELSAGEESLVMQFQMDVTRGLSYKGKDIRFYLTIPSFGMDSVLDRQLAVFNVSCNEQYIRRVEFGDTATGAYTDFLSWASRHDSGLSSVVTQNRVAMDAGNNYVFDVSNPYYFIKQGGLTMPDYVKIYVGNADGKGIVEVYDGIETFWSGGSGNKTRIYYNRETVESSFQIEMDNQSFKLEFRVTPWILDDTLLFEEQTLYGEEEVILLPGSAKRSATGRGILTLQRTLTDNDTYQINFGEGRTETFNGIMGGGTYMSHYNKWSFDTVDFSGDGTPQYARLTLGGKGGQEIQWSMRTTVKHLVNNTIANSYALRVGERITLPTTYQQVFSGSTFSSTGTVNNAPAIDVQYSKIKLFSQSGRSGVRQDENALNQLEGWRSTPAVPLSEWEVTDQQIKENKKDHIAFYEYRDPDFEPTDEVKEKYFTASPAYITWDATANRAYPSPNRSVGGVIYLTCYRTPDVNAEDNTHKAVKINSEEDVYMHHPDAFYGYSDLRPGINDRLVKYNLQEMSPNGKAVSDANAHLYNVPASNVKLKAKQSSSGHWHEIEGMIPTIDLQTNSLFDVRNLPTISVRSKMDAIIQEATLFTGQKEFLTGFNWDFVYMVPWSTATVYYSELSEWANGSYGIPLTAGISGIDTGRAGVYTLVVEMDMKTSVYRLVLKLYAHSYG